MLLKLRYHSSLYIGESISGKKLDRIKKNLEAHPVKCRLFLVTTSQNATDQLEIYSSSQLVSSYYKKNPPFVVGIAGNYEEAVGLVERLVQDCLRVRGDCALKEYLLC